MGRFCFIIFLLLFCFPLYAEILCSSCQEEFCSPSTQLGFVSGTKLYSFDVTISCTNCVNYTMRIALDDSIQKRYIKEEQITQDGDRTYNINLQNFYISDGIVSVYFELSATGSAGYEIVESFSCKMFYDDYPKPPSGVRAIPKESSFIVRWNTHPDRDIAKFRVYWGFPDSCSSDSVETTTYEIEITSLRGEEIKNGVRYCGFVEAVDNGGKVSEKSDYFYVIPAKTFHFAEGEEVGCIISNIFGKNSAITEVLRKFRDFILKLPGGRFLVRAYYKISWYILDFLSSTIAKDAYGYDYIASIGAGIVRFGKLGIFQGQNLFELSYGKTVVLADFLLGRKLSFLPIFVSVRANPSIMQGKRLIFSDTGEITTTGETYSTLVLMPVGVGLELFGDFVEEQIFVPTASFHFYGNFLFESYPDGSKFVSVFGPSFSFGGNILLDMFDRRSEAVARSEYNIENSYFFVRGTFFFINLVRKKGLNFSKSSYFDFSSFYLSGGVSFSFE